MLLEGMHLPLTTPFTPDGRLNLRKLEQNVAHYSLTPAAGMVVLGRTGEPESLSDVETREVMSTAVQAALSAKVMIAGVTRVSVRGTRALIEDAAAMGYDATLVRVPAGLVEKEIRVYLQTVTDASPLPVVIAGDLSLGILADMSAHPNVLGWLSDTAGPDEVRALLDLTNTVKRTVTVTSIFSAVTGRMLAAQPPEQPGAFLSADSLIGGVSTVAATLSKPALKTRTKIVGFQILIGKTDGMLASLMAGAVGAVPPFAAAAPQGCYEVMAAWKDGDPALAEEKQLRLIEAVRHIEGHLGTAGIKFGCDQNGYFGGMPRLPLLPLTGAQRNELEHQMRGLRS